MKAKKEVLTEQETRAQYFSLARRLGCEVELRQVFDKFDNLMKTCKNAVERKQIAILANVEVYRLIGFGDGLQVAGTEIIPPDPDFKMPE